MRSAGGVSIKTFATRGWAGFQHLPPVVPDVRDGQAPKSAWRLQNWLLRRGLRFGLVCVLCDEEAMFGSLCVPHVKGFLFDRKGDGIAGLEIQRSRADRLQLLSLDAHALGFDDERGDFGQRAF